MRKTALDRLRDEEKRIEKRFDALADKFAQKKAPLVDELARVRVAIKALGGKVEE